MGLYLNNLADDISTKYTQNANTSTFSMRHF